MQGVQDKDLLKMLATNPFYVKQKELGVSFHFTGRTREHYNAGYYAQERGEFKEAIEHYKKPQFRVLHH